MRKATHIVAASFGILAGIAGLEHGYFEIMRADTSLENMMFFLQGDRLVCLKKYGMPVNRP